jgi:hypothetical protein
MKEVYEYGSRAKKILRIYFIKPMKILNLRDRCISVLFILLMSCNNQQTSKTCTKMQNLNSNGYIFYESINLNERKWSNKINSEDCNSFLESYFGVLEKEDRIVIYSFLTNNKSKYTTYIKKDSFLISTEIFKDYDFQSLYHREISIIHKTKTLKYTYKIFENFEKLAEVEIVNINGDKLVFTNSTNDYYDFRYLLDEENIQMFFPTLVQMY